jgi:3-hydroxy-9,10-secoandrosta-1,3,5(10)-triene-9,17-dione monooxygenase
MTTREKLVEQARELAPVVRERALETEELRRLPDATVADFRQAGLLRAFVPEAFGGYGLELGTVIETAREVAAGCGSAGWCLAICTLHNRMVASLPLAAQEEVFGATPDAVVCGVFMPGGTALPVEGGYRLSGHWDFASASDHASHAILSALVRSAPEDPPTGLVSCLVRRADFEIEDNWHVAGLAGTGSKRVAVRDVFVPTDWTLGADKGMPGVPAPATRGLPTNSVATLGLAGVPLGIARGALDGFRERLATKLRAASFRGAADQVGAQHRLGAAAAEVDAAGLLVLRDCDEMERSAAAGKSATKEQRGRYRRDAAFAFQTCAGAVARLLPAAGAHAIFRDGPLQRSLRDTQVMATHIVADWDQGRESYARALLDLPIEDPVF